MPVPTKLDYAKDRFGLEGVITILPHGDWTPLMYAARQGSLGAVRVLADTGAGLNLADPDGSTAAAAGDHQRPLRYRRAAGAKGRRPQSRRHHRHGRAVCRGGHEHAGRSLRHGPPRQVSGDTSALDLMQAAAGAWRESQRAVENPDALPGAHAGRADAGRGSDALDARRQERRCRRHAPASRKRRRRRTAQKNDTTALMLAAGLGRGLGVFAKDYATEAQMIEGLKVLLDRHVNVNAHERCRANRITLRRAQFRCHGKAVWRNTARNWISKTSRGAHRSISLWEPAGAAERGRCRSRARARRRCCGN